MPELLAYSRYRHPSLRIEVGELGYEVRPAENGPQHGLLLVSVDPNGPAAAAGLTAATAQRQGRRTIFSGGDILLAIDDQALTTRDDLTLYLEQSTVPGSVVTITYDRDGATSSVLVTVGEE